MKHLIHRESGYSHIVSTLESLLQRANLRSTRINYAPDPVPHAGLNSVAVTIPLEGNYSNIVRFVREVENSDTFFLITAIGLSGAAGGTSGSQTLNAGNTSTGNVSLSLQLETYFYQ